MKIYNRSKQFNKGIYTCSAMRRLFEASLIVLGLLCVFWNTNVLRAFSYEEITARITVVCQKTEGLKNNSYQICIKPESGNVPVPDKDTIAIDDSGQGEFLLKLTEPGTYNYLLYENLHYNSMYMLLVMSNFNYSMFNSMLLLHFKYLL